MGRIVVILFAFVSLCFYIFIVTTHNRTRVNVLAKNPYFSPLLFSKIRLIFYLFPVTKIVESNLNWREAPKFLNV